MLFAHKSSLLASARNLLLAGATVSVLMLSGKAMAQQTGSIGDQTTNPQGNGMNPQELSQKASYILGRQIYGGFVRDEVPIDLKALLQGIQDEAAGKESSSSQEEIETVMRAFSQMVQAQVQEKMRTMADSNLKESQEFLKANSLKPGIKQLENGIQYQVLKEGTGASPKPTDTVTVHYTGSFLDGEVFDSSVKRGQPATFPLDRVIKGWTETVPRMKVGDKWKLFIPPGLAYGERGNEAIPPNKLLVFEIELLEIGGE